MYILNRLTYRLTYRQLYKVIEKVLEDGRSKRETHKDSLNRINIAEGTTLNNH